LGHAAPQSAGTQRSSLTPSAPEYEVLVGKVWQRTSVSFQAISSIRDVGTQATDVRQACETELAARW
jgi:hypothetical protein